SQLGWLAAGTAGLDEDGIVALFTSVRSDFRHRRGAAGGEMEGVACTSSKPAARASVTAIPERRARARRRFPPGTWPRWPARPAPARPPPRSAAHQPGRTQI